MTSKTPEEQEFVDMLLDWGALYVGGKDEDGSDIYFMDAEVMKDVCRPFYDAWMRDIDDALIGLYKKGLIDVTYDESLKSRFSIRTEPREDLD
jgi:hypothetical protein